MPPTARYPCCGGECPFCIENKRGRSSHSGHWGYRAKRRRKVRCEMPFRTPSGFSRLASAGGQPAAYGDWDKRLPCLCSFLCDLVSEDGTSRASGKLSLWTDDGLWKACLADPTAQAVCFLSAQGPSELLQQLEKGLKEDKLEWRRQRPLQKHQTGRTR